MRAVIDRIDEDIAVLISIEDESLCMNVPVPFLPSGSREGDFLTISCERDPEAARAAHERVQGLIVRLKEQ